MISDIYQNIYANILAVVWRIRYSSTKHNLFRPKGLFKIAIHLVLDVEFKMKMWKELRMSKLRA